MLVEFFAWAWSQGITMRHMLRYRRLKARLGPAQATVATAHAIARVVYRMLKYKVEYETISVEEYEKKYQTQQLKYMRKKAAKLGYQLVPA